MAFDCFIFRSSILEHFNLLKEEYSNKVISYYGWFWGDSSFVNIIKILACFEFLLEENLEAALGILENGIQIVSENWRKFENVYDASILDDAEPRRRKSFQLCRIIENPGNKIQKQKIENCRLDFVSRNRTGS